MGDDDSGLSDKVSKTALNIFSIALAVAVAAVLMFGFYDFYRPPSGQRQCEMTYMYEFPHFVKIPLKNGADEKYPMYGLYIYAEGRQVERARKGMYSGIPVLFLPGNAGSYKQARSFASVSLYKTMEMYTPFHFDFYSIDFNEEMSALYGSVLSRQLEYTRLAIDRITQLYEDHHRVVILSHSMGGIVAKAVNSDELKSHLIFTFATPHAHPVLIFDPDFDIFYHRSQLNMTQIEEESEQNVTVVSIAGGPKDLLVPDKLTESPLNDFQTSTVAVPGAWVSCDHLSILWCKQIVKVIVRILFDLVVNRNAYKKGSHEYARITTDPKLINAVLSYHLYQRSSGKSLLSAFPEESIVRPPKASWEEILTPNYCKSETHQPIYIMYPLISIREKLRGEHENNIVTILTSNTKAKSWLFGCKEQDITNNIRYCSNLANLTPFGEILPNKRKVAHVDYELIKSFSHLIVKTLPTDSRFCVNFEVNERKVEPLPHKLRIENKLFLNFSVNHMDKRFTAWRVGLASQGEKCNSTKAVGVFKHDNYQVYSVFKNESLLIRFTNWSSDSAHVLLYLDPKCEYNMSLTVAYIETAGQVFRTYILLLPAYFASIVLLSVFFQTHHEDWGNFHLLLLKNAFNFTVIPGFIVGILLTCVPTDYLKIMDRAEVSVFLPVFCYSAAFALVFLVTAGGWFLLVGSGNALHAILMKFLSKRLGKLPDKVTDLALDFTFAKFPVLIAVFLIALSAATCGGLGILAGFIIYLIKIFKMYEDILDDLLKGKIKDVKEGLSPLNFHQTVATLWFVVAALNIPSVIYWVRNFQYGESAQWDMSLYVSLMLTPVVAILWQEFVPRYNEKIWIIQRYTSYLNGVLIVLWGTHRLYIISFFITLYLITLAFTQLFSSLLDMASKSESRAGEQAAAAAAAASSSSSLGTSSGSSPQDDPSSPDVSQAQSSAGGAEETGATTTAEADKKND